MDPTAPRVTVTLALHVPRLVWAALVVALLAGSCASVLVADAVAAGVRRMGPVTGSAP